VTSAETYGDDPPWTAPALKWVTLLLPAAAFSTMVLGAFVKAVYGGMACPEWPTCEGGNFFVEFRNEQVASEILHRAAALLVSAAGVVLLYLVLTRYAHAKQLRLLTFAAAATLAVQIGLGAQTIFSALDPYVVTAHLAVATLFFGLTLLIAVEARKVLAAPAPHGPGGAPA